MRRLQPLTRRSTADRGQRGEAAGATGESDQTALGGVMKHLTFGMTHVVTVDTDVVVPIRRERQARSMRRRTDHKPFTRRYYVIPTLHTSTEPA